MLAGAEGLSVLVVPGLVCLVLVAHEDGVAIPVVGLAAQVVTALEQKDFFAGRSEVIGESAAPRTGADDDHVVIRHAGALISRPEPGQR